MHGGNEVGGDVFPFRSLIQSVEHCVCGVRVARYRIPIPEPQFCTPCCCWRASRLFATRRWRPRAAFQAHRPSPNPRGRQANPELSPESSGTVRWRDRTGPRSSKASPADAEIAVHAKDSKEREINADYTFLPRHAAIALLRGTRCCCGTRRRYGGYPSRRGRACRQNRAAPLLRSRQWWLDACSMLFPPQVDVRDLDALHRVCPASFHMLAAPAFFKVGMRPWRRAANKVSPSVPVSRSSRTAWESISSGTTTYGARKEPPARWHWTHPTGSRAHGSQSSGFVGRGHRGRRWHPRGAPGEPRWATDLQPRPRGLAIPRVL